MSDVLHFPTPKYLTDEQRDYFETELELAERKAEFCRRALGRIGLERGVER